MIQNRKKRIRDINIKRKVDRKLFAAPEKGA